MSKNSYKGTILISEDNHSNMKLLKDLLEFNKYKIVEAYDGKSAINKINEYKNTIDLILMDLQLPEIDGLEVIKIVKADQSTKDLPIFVISAHAMESDIQKAMKAGCNDYITKPINISTFIDKVNSFFSN